MENTFELITVNAENVDKLGFFCYMSKRKAPGYAQKRAWLAARFTEGLKILMVHETGGRTVGFIEYIPGEYAWRAVNAPGYMLIHCLWVVGKGKGKGYGTRLIEACLEDARAQGMHGVATVATDRVWMAKKDIFIKNGFEEIDQAPPAFHLLVRRFDDAPLPTFPGDWEARQAKFGAGLTIVRTPQCPYVDDAVNGMAQVAQEKGLPTKIVELRSAQEVRDLSPTPYGVFGIVLDGKLFTYHYLLPKDFEKFLAAQS
ncbi:MAG: GNAT family N-acetyltransferase [Anaerolineae bacterium]|nr:GNAT family N-acetyltransferase [Anaerolineae bacterium]